MVLVWVGETHSGEQVASETFTSFHFNSSSPQEFGCVESLKVMIVIIRKLKVARFDLATWRTLNFNVTGVSGMVMVGDEGVGGCAQSIRVLVALRVVHRQLAGTTRSS